MRTAAFTPPAPAMPAAWPATSRVRPVKKRIPDTTDGPKRIGYYLEPLRGYDLYEKRILIVFYGVFVN